MVKKVFISCTEESDNIAQEITKKLIEKNYEVFPTSFKITYGGNELNSSAIKAISSRDKNLPHVASIMETILEHKINQIDESQLLIVVNDFNKKITEFNLIEVVYAWTNGVSIYLWEKLVMGYPFYTVLQLFNKKTLDKNIDNLPYGKIKFRRGKRRERDEMQEKQ